MGRALNGFNLRSPSRYNPEARPVQPAKAWNQGRATRWAGHSLQRRKFMSATMNPILDIGVAKQIGKYSDAVQVPRNARWLFISGTPGLTPDGVLPKTFEEQAEQAWRNVLQLLKQAGMAPEHLVKIVQYLVRAEDIAAYGPVRSRMLGACRPASMLLVVPALVRPEFLIEVEAFAAAPE